MEGNLVDILTASSASENILFVAKASDFQEFAKEFAAMLLKQAAIDQKKEKLITNRKPLLSRDACALLQITMPTLMKYRRKGLFKGHVFDGKVYYFENELIEALQSKNKG